ncbi:MAG TPA: phosphate signaling complex protein PhoU [Anaerolineae bacterium]|nr:phosphate signaling complex protein PhoU [Anaerolineae bacterium]
MTYLLHKEIEKLKQHILTLVAEVEENVSMSVNALINYNSELAEKVINIDLKIDQMEVELEEECLKILALHQPVANDLRFIIAVLKINNDLERISDLAVNISERAEFLVTRKRIDISFDFSVMAQKSQDMLRKSIDALVTLNTDIAYEVCKADDEVDGLNREFYDIVKTVIRKNPEYIEEMTHYLGVSRHLERIADHATNIAEDVIYMIDGNIVRHHVEDYKS